MAAGVGLSVEQKGLRELRDLIKAEEDGAQLRKELLAALRGVIAPAVDEIKSGAATGKRGGSIAKPGKDYKGSASAVSISAAIARGVGTQVRLSGAMVGVAVKASKRGMPRGFINAPKRFNAKQFKHKVFGRNVWVEQSGAPGFFDNPIAQRRADYRAAIIAVMEAMSARIASRSA